MARCVLVYKLRPQPLRSPQLPSIQHEFLPCGWQRQNQIPRTKASFKPDDNPASSHRAVQAVASKVPSLLRVQYFHLLPPHPHLPRTKQPTPPPSKMIVSLGPTDRRTHKALSKNPRSDGLGSNLVVSLAKSTTTQPWAPQPTTHIQTPHSQSRQQPLPRGVSLPLPFPPLSHHTERNKTHKTKPLRSTQQATTSTTSASNGDPRDLAMRLNPVLLLWMIMMDVDMARGECLRHVEGEGKLGKTMGINYLSGVILR